MFKGNLYTAFAWMIVLVLFFVSIKLQSLLLLNTNVSWLIDAGQRLIHGGTYTQNFFTPYPPIALLFYAPMTALSKWFGFTLVKMTRFYLYALTTGLLLFSYYLTREHFDEDDPFAASLFFVALGLVFYILPVNEFGLRHHLTVILVMPYLLLTASRLRAKTPRAWLSLIVGVLAGLGFVLNITFALVWILIEGLLAIRTRRWFSWMRLESLCVASIIIAYVASVFVCFPDFIHTILPMQYRYDFFQTQYTWHHVILNAACLSWLAVLLLIIACRRYLQQKNLVAVLFTAATGFLISFLLGGDTHFKHTIATLSMTALAAFILLTNLTTLFSSRLQDKGFKDLCQCAYIILLFACAIGVIFSITHYHAAQYIHYKNSRRSNFNHIKRYILKYNYRGPVYFFSTKSRPGTSIVSYTYMTSASRFARFWMLPEMLTGTQKKTRATRKDVRFITRAVVNDFKKNKPHMVFVNTQLDYVKLFSTSKSFRKLWRKYRYRKTINDYKIYTARR